MGLRYIFVDLTTNPLKLESISELIQNFNNLITKIEEDKNLKEADKEIQTIRRLLNNAEGELLRFNSRLRKVMERILKRLPTVNNSTETTSSISPASADA